MCRAKRDERKRAEQQRAEARGPTKEGRSKWADPYKQIQVGGFQSDWPSGPSLREPRPEGAAESADLRQPSQADRAIKSRARDSCAEEG